MEISSLYSAVVFGDHVLSCVCGQLGTVREALVALVASQVFIRTVCRHVRYHLAACREYLVALIALRHMTLLD